MRTDSLIRARRWAALLVLLALPVVALAEGEGGTLPAAQNDIENIASLQRGARNFVNYCSGCHSAQYVRYNRIGADLEIPDDTLRAELLFNPAAKLSDTIKSALPAADAKTWFGTAPPDLSVMSRARGSDYIYNYLKGFYRDPSRPTGVNNVMLTGTAMPDVLANLQGVQKAVYRKETRTADDGKQYQEDVFDHFEVETPGTLKPAEFDDFVRDTVNFLQYMGEPVQAKRQAMGVWVTLFLLLFTIFSYLLYRNYWRDVH